MMPEAVISGINYLGDFDERLLAQLMGKEVCIYSMNGEYHPLGYKPGDGFYVGKTRVNDYDYLIHGPDLEKPVVFRIKFKSGGYFEHLGKK